MYDWSQVKIRSLQATCPLCREPKKQNSISPEKLDVNSVKHHISHPPAPPPKEKITLATNLRKFSKIRCLCETP